MVVADGVAVPNGDLAALVLIRAGLVSGIKFWVTFRRDTPGVAGWLLLVGCRAGAGRGYLAAGFAGSGGFAGVAGLRRGGRDRRVVAGADGVGVVIAAAGLG